MSFSTLRSGWLWRHLDGDPTPSGGGDPPPTPAPPPTGQDPASGGRDYEAEIAKLRQENANWRVKHREAEAKNEGQLAAIAKALGLQQDGTPDPAKLQQELTTKLAERDAELRQLRVDGALSKAADKLGAKLELTRAVLLASGKLADLDPADAKAVEAVISDALKAHPELKVGQAPARGGAPINGGQGGSDQLTREDVQRMYREGKTAEIQQARREGRLTALMGG